MMQILLLTSVGLHNKHDITKTVKGNKIAREAVALNRKMGTYGNGDGKDASHNMHGPGKHGLESPSANRARPRKKNKNKLYIAK